ncbi:MAG: hypothetical protein PWP48_843 [Clostridiales bacterium]|jgi:hypothetical protein|nr:hypothetical protein [Clostridiales bacterium]
MPENISQFIPFLVPIIVIQFGLMVAAIIHILHHNKYRFGNRALWLVISIFIGIIGPVLYFTIGKGDE